MLTCLVPVLFAFYLQSVLKFKCKIPTPKGQYYMSTSAQAFPPRFSKNFVRSAHPSVRDTFPAHLVSI